MSVIYAYRRIEDGEVKGLVLIPAIEREFLHPFATSIYFGGLGEGHEVIAMDASPVLARAAARGMSALECFADEFEIGGPAPVEELNKNRRGDVLERKAERRKEER